MPPIREIAKSCIAHTLSKRWFWRALRFSIVTIAVAFCVLLLAVRFWVFPRIENGRDEVESWMGGRLGQKVAIAQIATGWDGWNPKIHIRGLRISDRVTGAELLELPDVAIVVGWISVPLFDIRLKELAIEHPNLDVRRDAEGMLHIGGLKSWTAIDVLILIGRSAPLQSLGTVARRLYALCIWPNSTPAVAWLDRDESRAVLNNPGTLRGVLQMPNSHQSAQLQKGDGLC